MIISNKYQFVFWFTTGNCATSSIFKALLPIHDDDEVVNRKEPNISHELNTHPNFVKDVYKEGWFNNKLIINKHTSPKELFGYSTNHLNKLKDYKHCVVVRNPWDWVLAVFQKNLNNKGSASINKDIGHHHINEFDVHKCNRSINYLRNAAKYISQYNNACYQDKLFMNRFFRFENIQEDFQVFIDELQIPNVKFSHENNTGNQYSQNYRDIYTDEAKDLVSKVYAQDIEFFNYTF